MTAKRLSLAIALALAAAVLLAQIAAATHPRPRGATPVHVALVPAFKQCTSPNSTHGPPLAFGSCAPPVQESSYLTVGSPDANGAPANSVGSVTIKVVAPSFENEIRLTGSITDVRCLPGTSASVCNNPNTHDGPDYSGQLLMNTTIRISDHYNGPNLDQAATVIDVPFPANLNCANTVDTTTGGVCTVTTAATCPPNCSISGRRTVVEFGQIEIRDGGADGNVSTGPDTVFMREGVFIP
jgi:hypothetical protein